MKHAILLVAYGFATMRSRRVLSCFDERVRTLYPAHSVRWAYSSPLVRKRLALSGLKCDSVPKALLRMSFERFERVVIQPLQTIAGKEHDTMLEQIETVTRDQPLLVQVGAPLLHDRNDTVRVAQSLIAHLPGERGDTDAVVFMGHGSKHPAGVKYEELHACVQERDPLVHVATMDGRITLDTIMPRLSSRRVWLLPLLSTVGRHTLRDMAGSSESSWRSRLEARGFECRVVLQGTVEYAALADIWLDHLALAVRLSLDM